MIKGINDLDDDDDVIVEDEFTPQEPSISEPSLDNFMQDYLKTIGIEDYEKIKFEDDNGLVVERKWDDLTKEEKFNILNTPKEVVQEDNNNLTDEELNFINQLRSNNITVSDYINSITLEPVNQEPLYKIDDLSDDEIFILDLESRVGEISDEEAAQALTNAKQNEEFFKKQVEGIRKEYKEREDFLNQLELASLEEQQRLAFEEYQAKVVDAIEGFNSIGNLDLNFEDKDKEELAEFMLSQDETGANYLYQALLDPETLTKAAWFILNGEEAFNNVADYFTTEIKRISEALYKKGLEDGRKGVVKPTVVIDKSNNNRNIHRSYNSINDLDDED